MSISIFGPMFSRAIGVINQNDISIKWLLKAGFERLKI